MRRGGAAASRPQMVARAESSVLMKKRLVLVGFGPAGWAALLPLPGCLAGAALLPGPPPARGGPPVPASLSGSGCGAGRLVCLGRAVVGLVGCVASGPCWPSGPVWGPGRGGLATQGSFRS